MCLVYWTLKANVDDVTDSALEYSVSNINIIGGIAAFVKTFRE